MIINEIPLVLHTMDKYSKYWNIWWHFFNKHCSHRNIVFLSEEMAPDFTDKVTHIKTGEGQWGERLLRGLSNVNSELIFYSQEDFWPIKDFPFNQDSVNIFENEQLDCLRISWPYRDYQLTQVADDLYRYNQHSPYTLSHQFSLWKKPFLQKYILPNENPWENEVFGTKRMNENPHKIYFISNSWYNETVHFGKLRGSGLDMLNQNNIEIGKDMI
jgi:hypothetical protein